MKLNADQKKERMKSVSRHINIVKANLLDMYQLLDVMDNDTRIEVRDNISKVKDELNVILLACKWQFEIKE